MTDRTAICTALSGSYDALWTAAAPNVRHGHIQLDAWATRKPDDARRGITLLARPTPAVADALDAFLAELRAVEPAQYYQPRSDLHLTVLSLFTATVDHAPHLAQQDAYRGAVDDALDGAPSFAVDFEGVTLSNGAVLAKGFPHDHTLEQLRARLRAALTAHDFGDGLDRRYRLETAHLTLARFTSPLRDPARFVDLLELARHRAFGTSLVTTLELVIGDWYQSAEHTHTLATYPLA